MIECIIFDNDGTLIDSEPLQHKCMELQLAKYGYEVSRHKMEELYRGWKLHDILADIGKSFANFSLPENFIADYRLELDKIFLAELKTMPGVIAAIRQICLPICIASSGPRAKIETAMKITGLKQFFGERIFSAYEIGAWKPDPKLFLVAAAKMGFKPENCLVIEDSEVGVKGGLAAGMQVLHYNPLEIKIPFKVAEISHFDQLNAWLAKNS